MYFKLLSSGASKVSFREYEFMPHGYLLYHLPFTTSVLYTQVKKIIGFICETITGGEDSKAGGMDAKTKPTKGNSKQAKAQKTKFSTKRALKERMEAIIE